MLAAQEKHDRLQNACPSSLLSLRDQSIYGLGSLAPFQTAVGCNQRDAVFHSLPSIDVDAKKEVVEHVELRLAQPILHINMALGSGWMNQ